VSCWVKIIVSTTCTTGAGKTGRSAEGRLQSVDDLQAKKLQRGS
jgi:hypothetical protein